MSNSRIFPEASGLRIYVVQFSGKASRWERDYCIPRLWNSWLGIMLKGFCMVGVTGGKLGTAFFVANLFWMMHYVQQISTVYIG